MSVIREEIYKAIEEERLYQDGIPVHSKEQDEGTSIADWILYMEHQLESAKSAVYHLSSSDALCHIRKVTALGVACMEYRGMVTRKEETDRITTGSGYYYPH